MRDFTLYLNWIDCTRFSKEQSRFGLDKFADEWRAAWHAYEMHVVDAASLLGREESHEYALANWRQNLSELLCIRRKPVTKIEFNVAESLAEIIVSNTDLYRDLKFQYSSVRSFIWTETWAEIWPESWIDDNPFENVPRDAVELPILYLEELRFPQAGSIEHEIIFLDGSRLLISAASIKLNLADYLHGY